MLTTEAVIKNVMRKRRRYYSQLLSQSLSMFTLLTRKFSCSVLVLVIIALFYFFQNRQILLTASGVSVKVKSKITSQELLLPKRPPFEAKFVQKLSESLISLIVDNPLKLKCSNCAIVFSSGHLTNSSSGSKIDSADCVVRFNDAPTGGVYAKDVGDKTTVRFVGNHAAKEIVSRKLKLNDSLIRNEIIILNSVHSEVLDLIEAFPQTEFYVTSKSAFSAVFSQELENIALEGNGKSVKVSSGENIILIVTTDVS